MEIRELSTSYKMSITISNGQSNVTLHSDIVSIVANKMYVEPFMHNGVVLSFNSENVSISMIAYEDEKTPYFWKTVTVEKEMIEDKVYHVISSGLIGVRLNRRENYRVYVGIEGKARLASSNERIDVIVKDISETGFAVLVDVKTEAKINTNDALFVEFYDSVQEMHLSLMGRIVRGAVSEKYYLFGCRTLKDDGMSRKYIANKQLEKRINSMKKTTAKN